MLRLEDVKKTYYLGESRIDALEIENLQIEEGDFISVVGPSGSGKTTFLNIIALMDKPTEGRIIFEDNDVLNIKRENISKYRREIVGYVFQSFNLLPHLTALENVMLPLIPYKVNFNLKERAVDILEKVGLKERMKHLPSQLSGGEQQRVAIARAMINNPKILIADEPTGNLDTKMRDEIINLFSQINNQGYAIVIATHDMEAAQKTKRIIHLRDGKVAGIEVNSYA